VCCCVDRLPAVDCGTATRGREESIGRNNGDAFERIDMLLRWRVYSNREVPTVTMIERIQQNAKSARWVGLLLLMVGVLSLLAPLAAGVSAAIVVGVFLLTGGIAELVLVFQAGSVGKALAVALLNLVAGLYMIVQPAKGLLALTVFLATYFALTGVTEIAAAFQARSQNGWSWLAFGGALSLSYPRLHDLATASSLRRLGDWRARRRPPHLERVWSHRDRKGLRGHRARRRSGRVAGGLSRTLCDPSLSKPLALELVGVAFYVPVVARSVPAIIHARTPRAAIA
jgi:uncharacterized membrane protein HdeD (DUF308 family)